ncbi:hypothetical protein KIPB_002574 [Kipferlia bialata]|uniref:DUF7726 domain-containing protein n=1 Tax=Kipferlia bialata TaxID=797122 RepID=A0A9K3CSF3_9EUKA|nr:hypothetical protein KIPB_002574 [Kipferlia bialata]|eukprot:g2574.t1
MATLEDQLEAIGGDNGFCYDTDWQPRTASGKLKSPGVIRGEITRFLAKKTMTQTEFLRRIGCNPGSYHRFMTGKYKDPWSATSNQTYMTAAIFLAKEKIRVKIAERDEKARLKAAKALAKKEGKGAAAKTSPVKKGPSAAAIKKAENAALLAAISAVDVAVGAPVYDCCDTVRQKINRFIISSGVTMAAFLRCIDINSGSWAAFSKMKGAGAGAANAIYPAAYRFFEQLRLKDNKPKSKKRLEAEAKLGARGYMLRHDNGMRYVVVRR